MTLTIHFLEDRSFLINLQKSKVVPNRDIIHIGARIDTHQLKVFLPTEKQMKIKKAVQSICKEKHVDLIVLLSLLISMI